METNFLIILLLLTFANSKLISESFCQKIECSESLDTDTCVKVSSATSFLKECPTGKICNIEFDDPIQDSKCVEEEKTKFKRLPTLPCETNDDCLSGECKGNTCVGKYGGEKCNSPSDCVYGYTCRKDSDNIYKCLDPITTGNKCEYHTDCVGESGCLNNICTPYFSVENNQYGSDYPNEELSCCKSGYSDELGKCINLTLIEENSRCSEDNKCKYSNENNETVEINSNCLCGYNTEGDRYCLLGSGNKNYTKYIQLLKDYYLYNKNCHLSERNAAGCQKDLLSNDEYIKKKIQVLINAKYWAKSNNKLIKAPECAFKVELPDYDRELDKDYNPDPLPGEGKCAVYSCKASDYNNEFCATSNFKNVFNISVSLYDICSDDVACKIGGDPNEVFYNQTNVYSKCYSKIENKRYPGEKCEVDSECVYPLNNPSSQFHKCEEGRCNGMEENGICEDNTWCKAGYYCDKYSGKCKEQKGKNDACLETKECQNNLICLEKKCSDKLYSLVDGKELPNYEDVEIQKRFCKSGEVFNFTCVSYNDIANKTGDDQYEKCNFGEKCVYAVKGLSFEKKLEIPCPCGYNSEGVGYCPHFHDYSTADWDEYRKILQDNFYNECHTENRYNCYKKEKIEKEKELRNKLEKGHLFYNSVECAKKVLKDDYLNIKKLPLLLGIIFILF